MHWRQLRRHRRHLLWHVRLGLRVRALSGRELLGPMLGLCLSVRIAWIVPGKDGCLLCVVGGHDMLIVRLSIRESMQPTTASCRFGLTCRWLLSKPTAYSRLFLSSSSMLGVKFCSEEDMRSFSHADTCAIMIQPSSESREARTAGAT